MSSKRVPGSGGSGRQREPDPDSEIEMEAAETETSTTLIEPFDMNKWMQEQFKKTPWWLISVAFHGLILACLTVITFSKTGFKEDPVVVVNIAGKAVQKIPDKELPRGIFDRAEGMPSATPQKDDSEPAIFFPGAEPSDHNESADGEDHGQMKGDSLEFRSYLPGQEGNLKGRQKGPGQGVTDAMGIGGGGGGAGRYGGRLGGRRNLVKVGGGSQATESAVLAGLRWLARHQASDGRWSAEGFHSRCGGGKCSGPGYEQFDVGCTSLALLAFLGAGYTHLSRSVYEDPVTKEKLSFGKCVKKGIEWLISVQDPDGCFGTRTGEFMYNHAIAALALAEAYGLTNAAVYQVPAQKGIDFIAVAQNPYLAWRYHVKPGDNDTSVSGWCVMALKSAEVSGLTTARTCFDGARAWLDRVTDKDTGEVGYTGLGKVGVIVPGKNDKWTDHPSMTAVGILMRIFIDKDATDARLAKGAALIVKDPPVWDEAKHTIDSYFWYYATLGLFLYKDGPGAKFWKQWNESMKSALCSNQKLKKHGCADGSWDPEVDKWGFAGGRCYMTAINVLTLEVYYRYESVFARKGDK